MRILIITPAPKQTRTGNRITALRWARLLRKLGHIVEIDTAFTGQNCDLLIALHAGKSHSAIAAFRERFPRKKLIVTLTGTDLYSDIQANAKAMASLEMADRLVLLQPKGIEELPAHLHTKCSVIYQSASRLKPRSQKNSRTFDICFIGHLREVKDPFRTAIAVRKLPESSRIRVLHIGSALAPEMAQQALAEVQMNPRYKWLGEKPRWQARQILAGCRLLALSSKMEGGANVISEAIMASVPVIATRISGTIGLLGENYPGYFSYGDTEGLRKLLLKAESDPDFLTQLRKHCEALAPKFTPATELQAMEQLIACFLQSQP